MSLVLAYAKKSGLSDPVTVDPVTSTVVLMIVKYRYLGT